MSKTYKDLPPESQPFRTPHHSAPVIGEHARTANRRYRANARQTLRNAFRSTDPAAYDALPTFRRSARWDAS